MAGRFEASPASIGLRAFAVAGLSGDGRLDLAGLSGAGAASRATGRGANNYHWQVIRHRAQKAEGDARINSYRLGGEVEVRAGLHVQRQVIAGPMVDFGLGEHPGTDVARIVWPNGTVQAEFNTKADHPAARAIPTCSSPTTTASGNSSPISTARRSARSARRPASATPPRAA